MAITYPLERTLQVSVLVVTFIFSIFAIITVCLRVLGRFKLGRWLDMSDYAMIGALATMLGASTAIVNAIYHAGLGFHVDEIIDRFGVATGEMDFLQHLMVVRVTTTFSLALSKISILILCCRVFTSKTFHWIANLTNGLVTLWAVANVIIIFRLCDPIAYNWDKTIPGFCGKDTGLWIGSGTVNILAGFIVLVLPMPYIYKLQLATYKKVSLMITFGIGFIVCIVSIIKVALVPSVNGTDTTYSMQHALILAMLECALAVIVACIPVLRPLFKNSTRAAAAAHSRYVSRNYSSVPPDLRSKNGGGSGRAFTELRNLVKGTGNGGLSGDDEEPLPMRPEKTYYNRIEAVGGRCSEDGEGRDVEMGGGMGGITVKTEFTASIEVVEVLDRAGRSSVRAGTRSDRGSLQHN